MHNQSTVRHKRKTKVTEELDNTGLPGKLPAKVPTVYAHVREAICVQYAYKFYENARK